jgi:hypothetical protein
MRFLLTAMDHHGWGCMFQEEINLILMNILQDAETSMRYSKIKGTSKYPYLKALLWGFYGLIRKSRIKEALGGTREERREILLC